VPLSVAQRHGEALGDEGHADQRQRHCLPAGRGEHPDKLDLIPEKLNVVNIFDARLNSAVEAYLKSAG